MKLEVGPNQLKPILLQGASLVVVLAVEFLLWYLAGGEKQNLIFQIGFWFVCLLLVLGVWFALRTFLRIRSERLALQQELAVIANSKQSLSTRLDGIVKLNQILVEAQSEQDLIEKGLEVIADMSGAVGCSFLPFDEWNQPLSPVVYGQLPHPVLKAWAQHLTAPTIRNRCKVCQKLETEAGESCPLLEGPFNDAARIYCLPLERGNRTAAMLNIYLPFGKTLPADLHEFLAVLLRELVLAVEMIRLKGQQAATLRQLQMSSDPFNDLSAIILRMLDGLCDALGFTSARIEFKAAPPQFNGLRLNHGDQLGLASDLVDKLIENTISGASAGAYDFKEAGINGWVVPVKLPEGVVIGALLLIQAKPFSITDRQQALIDTVTMQAALLVENERRQLDQEYRAVMRERARLAREIHDSLAQTLAYLKLTAAQMQSHLNHGDLSRLELALNQSYQALSDAYIETRQAIDNLRLAPARNINIWLEQIGMDFEKTTGLKVRRELMVNPPEIQPEIQAQLIRIVQEALSNIRKHANASQIRISLTRWKDELILEIQDNGNGFSSADVPDLSRHGLRGMRERSELIGAEFQIISKPDSGTTIRLNIPIQTEETPV